MLSPLLLLVGCGSAPQPLSQPLFQADGKAVALFDGESGASWVATGGQDGARLGDSVLGPLGDVNGDGYDDVVVGAPAIDQVWVWYGSASGLGEDPDLVFEGADGSDFGASAIGADLDCDGYRDLVVGAPSDTDGSVTGGVVRAFAGSASGLERTPSWRVSSDVDGAELGHWLATGTDMPVDGCDTLVATAPGWDDGEEGEGAAFAWHGGVVWPHEAPDFTVEGDQAGAQVSTAAMFDCGGSAHDSVDLFVGAPGYDDSATDSGRVWFFRGRGTHLSTIGSKITSGRVPGEALGSWLGRLPDSYKYDNVFMNNELLWCGDSGVEGGSWTFEIEGTRDEYRDQVRLVWIGDINEDGLEDWIGAWPGYHDDRGGAWLYLGSSSGAPSDHTGSISGGEGFELGTAVVQLGDVNGDGLPDVLLTAPGASEDHDQEGAALVFLSEVTNDPPEQEWSTEGRVSGAALGTAVAGAGDVDGDGYEDVVVGSPGFTRSYDEEGMAVLYYGSSTGLSATGAWFVDGGDEGLHLGHMVSGGGDVDGDGYDDVLIGSHADDYSDAVIQLYTGSSTGLSGTAAWTATRDGYLAGPGREVAMLGDTDGDGLADFVASDRYDTSRDARIVLWYGDASGPASSPDSSVSSIASDSWVDLEPAGDFNGDGYADLLAGTDYYYTDTGALSSAGQAWVNLGSVSGLSRTKHATVTGSGSGAKLGGSVVDLGDIDGDGFDDVAAGMSTSSRTGVAIVLGDASATGTTAWSTWLGEYGWDSYSGALTACDLDDTGLRDLVIDLDSEVGLYGYADVGSDEPATASWTRDWDGSGAEISDLGCADVDGDGIDQLLVGMHSTEWGGDAGEVRVYGY